MQQNGAPAPQQNGASAPQQSGASAPQQNGASAPQQNGAPAPQELPVHPDSTPRAHRVLYPGSFDPVHNGHIDVVETAARLFDEVIVAAMRNPGKSEPLFDFQERENLLNEVFAHLPSVRTVMFSGLVVDLATSLEADFILKGLRQVSDFESELLMAQTNKAVAGTDTLFLPTDPAKSFISSKYIREIARFGGRVDTMVPPIVLERLQAKFGISSEVVS